MTKKTTPKRSGKTLAVLPDGAPRRMSDGKNAWRKMNADQRAEFMSWICDGTPKLMTAADAATLWKGNR